MYRFNEVVHKCWEIKPENRPHFGELVSLVSSFLEFNAGYLSFSNSIPEKIATVKECTTVTTGVDLAVTKTVEMKESTAMDEFDNVTTTH